MKIRHLSRRFLGSFRFVYFPSLSMSNKIQFAVMYNIFLGNLQAFGGGGHRNASSFMLKSAEFENWKVSNRTST